LFYKPSIVSRFFPKSVMAKQSSRASWNRANSSFYPSLIVGWISDQKMVLLLVIVSQRGLLIVPDTTTYINR
jgi:hypothetical protein